MVSVIDSIVQWFAKLAGGDVVALILVFAAGSLAVTAAKNAIKVLGAVVGGLAVLYLIDPSLYSTISSSLGRFVDSLRSGAASAFSG